MDINGNIDSLSMMNLRRQKWKERQKELDAILHDCLQQAEEEIKKSMKPPRTKRTCFRKAVTQVRLPDGTLVDMTPWSSPWYTSYVTHPQIGDDKFEKKFRLRFRCTFSMYGILLLLIKDNDLFSRWHKYDAAGRPPSPIELLLLGSLRYIGRGWTFDDLEEATAISEETHRQFFHVFIKWGSTDFFNRNVTLPATNEEWKSHSHEFGKAGLNGCIASMDATHISMERCPYARWNQHKGPKSNAQCTRPYIQCLCKSPWKNYKYNHRTSGKME
jgi:hypothetical protein